MFNFLFAAVGKILWWLAQQLARLIAWMTLQAVFHPRSTTTAGAMAAGIAWFGWQLCLTVAGGLFVTLSTWKAAHPVSFGKTFGTWARTWWHKWWIYRRTWKDAFTRCDLTVQAGTEVHLPKLKRMRTTPYWDHLRVEMQVGQAASHFLQRSDELRGAFRAERIVVKEVKPRGLEMAFMRRDPLLASVPATSFPASVDAIDWRAIPIGLTEFGDLFTVSLLGGHTCCAGSTGGGKSGVQWNILRGIAPAIPAGLVRLVGIDPKGKELRRARALFAADDYAVTEDDVLALLERLVQEMNKANEADGAAGERDFRPRAGRPLTLIIIDELAPLLKYWTRRMRDKIEDALGLLLTQGRAVGYIVLGAIQEPTKDVFGIRDLFTRRLALRLPTESHTEAALVEKAVDYGAFSHQISESTPGVLFALQDGARATIRARLGHVRDADIDDLVAYVETATKVVNLDTWSGGGSRLENVA